jgi:hypothetical protein
VKLVVEGRKPGAMKTRPGLLIAVGGGQRQTQKPLQRDRFDGKKQIVSVTPNLLERGTGPIENARLRDTAGGDKPTQNTDKNITVHIAKRIKRSEVIIFDSIDSQIAKG